MHPLCFTVEHFSPSLEVAILVALLAFVCLIPQRYIRSFLRMGRFDPARQFLPQCPQHVLESSQKLILDEHYFAYSGYADLWQGRLGNRPVAVKVWRGASLSNASRRQFVKRLSQELDTWKRLKHRNVTPFYGLVSGLGYLPALVLPYYRNGNAMEYLARNPSADILSILVGLANALKYLHSSTPAVAHGNVKGSNVMIDDSGEPCLSDIGISTIPYPPDWTMGNMDNCRWMAPEIMDPGPDNDLPESAYSPTPQSDVYSFGMTALEMYSRRVPFSHRRFYGGVVFDVVVHAARPPRPNRTDLSDDVWDVMQSCWNQDPKKRPTIDTVGSWLQLLSQIQDMAVPNSGI